jgi:hypothetical protein
VGFISVFRKVAVGFVHSLSLSLSLCLSLSPLGSSESGHLSAVWAPLGCPFSGSPQQQIPPVPASPFFRQGAVLRTLSDCFLHAQRDECVCLFARQGLHLHRVVFCLKRTGKRKNKEKEKDTDTETEHEKDDSKLGSSGNGGGVREGGVFAR